MEEVAWLPFQNYDNLKINLKENYLKQFVVLHDEELYLSELQKRVYSTIILVTF